MSHFIFKAKRPDGEIYSSEREAADRFELYRLIREGGDEIVSAKERNAASGIVHWLQSITVSFNPVKAVEKINFVRNLGSMLEAGLALSRALSVIERQTRNKYFKRILTVVIADINRGTTFCDALKRYPKIFSELMTSMVHAGEQSGTLADSLRVVAIQMENANNLERRVRGALIYPMVILALMIVIGILMFIFVVPTLMKTFTELKVPLPFTTRMVLGASNFIQNQGVWVAIGAIIIFGGIYYWTRRPSGKRFTHALILKLPFIGSLSQEINAARTARTMSSLLGAGVDVVESVNITSEVVQNIYFKAVLKQAAEAIKKGDLMSKVFNAHTKLYPIFLAEMMSVGEETGKIKDMLSSVAHYYEDDVDQRTKDMSTVIEPALMVIIGGAVGFFAISIISPIYSLVNAV
ncbi:MAG: type II secretion system F family protein [Candidatus Taylorbacteria bacterium]|nr:type II secretion system F family protein [Candidatus Taylorbacteria bacterium]